MFMIWLSLIQAPQPSSSICLRLRLRLFIFMYVSLFHFWCRCLSYSTFVSLVACSLRVLFAF